ncbi:hypothetical protein HDU84_003951 [Entophlyctis sp. JEL0112]|nr:hypothetical protein HDU84_003951 [Entophlyctis sp. JEL0112]
MAMFNLHLLVQAYETGRDDQPRQWVLRLKPNATSTTHILSPQTLHGLVESFVSTAPEFQFLGQVGIIEGTYLIGAKSVTVSVPTARMQERVQRFFAAKTSWSVTVGVEEQVTRRRRFRRNRVDISDEAASVVPRRWSGRRQFLSESLQVPDTQDIRLPIPSHNVMGFNDPNFEKQWNLVWNRGINGTGVTVAILDDGVEFTHPDFLETSWSTESSFDFNQQSKLPLPVNPDDVHGTRCAGQVAASPNNSVCGVGVAFGARLAGIRIIARSTTDAMEAQALNYALQVNDVYSSSWGPDDDGMSVDGPGELSELALEAGTKHGRGGRGSVFVFASGNGGLEWDNCNFDGYANSVYTVAIGAINHKGKMPSYGEFCSAHLAVTYSSGAGAGIWTTDVDGSCTGVHSGTSATAPVASGIIALMLSVRPELSWRDIQDLIVKHSDQTDAMDSSWNTNGVGLPVSHKYGFGKLNAARLVSAAETARLLPSPQLKISKTMVLNSEFSSFDDVAADFDEPTFVSVINISDRDLWEENDTVSKASLLSLEHVQVRVEISHPARRYLTIVLESPAGTRSILASPRPLDMSGDGFSDWMFMTVHNWGESPLGSWTLEIFTDKEILKSNETWRPGDGIHEWELVLYGTCHPWDIVESGGTRTCGAANGRRATQNALLDSASFGAVGLTGIAAFAVAAYGIKSVVGIGNIARPTRSDGSFASWRTVITTYCLRGIWSDE